MQIIEQLAETTVGQILASLESVYKHIEAAQEPWRRVVPAGCAAGCGCCCVDFEPDVLECEALYLAAWMLEYRKDIAAAVQQGTFSMRTDMAEHSGCFLFDPDSPYHCTVYEGRCLVCRMFGYFGDRGKDGTVRWKPCRFIPAETLSTTLTALGKTVHHRQYTAAELNDMCGAVPPVMADFAAQALALEPAAGGNTRPLREALPEALKKIALLLSFSSPQKPEPDAPGTPPVPLSA